MSNEYNAMRPECAHALQEIALSLERLEARGAKLDDVHEAVMGNGNPHKGLASRVEGLEAALRTTWRVIGVCFAGVLVLVAVVGLFI